MITQAFMEFLSGIGDILSSILSYILYFFHWASEDTTSAGDIYVAAKFSRFPADILVKDTGVDMTVYSCEGRAANEL